MVRDLPVAALLVDGEGRIALSNERVGDLLGYSPADLLGEPVEKLVPERLRPAHRRTRQDYTEAPGEVRPMMGRALWGVSAEGVEIALEVGLTTVQVGSESVVLCTFTDLSDSVRVEELERLRRVAMSVAEDAETERERVLAAQAELDMQRRAALSLAEDLEAARARAERDRERLARAYEELEETNLELRRFVYAASHDLKEPVRSISGFCELLKGQHGDLLPDEALDWIDQAVTGSARMDALIDQLLNYSRIDDAAERFGPVDCSEVVDEVVDNLQAAIRGCAATVSRSPLPTVRGDRAQLIQLFQNLIGNGIKYRADVRPKIDVSAQRNGSGWVFSVRDNGLGSEPRHHERIFAVFKRLHTHDAFPGSGIGLAICRRVVVRHGGKLWLESEPGAGSTFYFSLPGIEEGEVSA